MKLIKPSFEIWEQPEGLNGIYRQIERAGRICYRSEDKITEDSAEPFVNRMMSSHHLSVLEHGTVYLAIPITTRHSGQSEIRYMDNKYSVVRESTGFTMKDDLGDECNCWCVTTNYRVLVENDWLDDLQYLCEPTKYHAKRITVRFVCDRGILAEFTRHRVFSFSAESTRYCNYSKDKFDNEITFIKPLWIKDELYCPSVHRVYDYLYNETYLEEKIPPQDRFIFGLEVAEDIYLRLVDSGWKPQEARAILPNALKTELVMTGFIDDWKHFFELRCAPNAHPQARELAIPLSDEFIKRGYINE